MDVDWPQEGKWAGLVCEETWVKEAFRDEEMAREIKMFVSL